MNPQRNRQGIRAARKVVKIGRNDIDAELNGLVIEPEVVEQDGIGGTTEVAVDVLYRSGENSVSLMVEIEGMCESLVEIVAEAGHVYVDLYRDWSQFLTAGDRCSIHVVSPFSCSHFDCAQSREEADALSLRGLMEVAKAWQRGDLYARLWMILYHAGRIAPSPIEARARMRAAIAAGECAGEDRSTSYHR